MFEQIDFGDIMVFSFILLGLISLILFGIDLKYIPKKRSDGKAELKVGYHAKFMLGLISFGLLSLVGGAVNGIIQKEETWMLYLIFSILVLYILIYRVLEILNYKIVFDKDEITEHNLFGKEKTIKLKMLTSKGKSIFGFGNEYVFVDTDGKKIKVSNGLPGYNYFVEFVDSLNLELEE